MYQPAINNKKIKGLDDRLPVMFARVLYCVRVPWGRTSKPGEWTGSNHVRTHLTEC
ncbi:unnamed protein product [Discosporangium mesarthrocarpum]